MAVLQVVYYDGAFLRIASHSGSISAQMSHEIVQSLVNINLLEIGRVYKVTGMQNHALGAKCENIAAYQCAIFYSLARARQRFLEIGLTSPHYVKNLHVGTLLR